MAKGGKRPGAGRKPDPTKQALAEAYTKALAEEVDKHKATILAALIAKAETGDIPAIKEIHDRLMGKAKETVEHSGKDGQPINMSIDLKSASTDELLGFLTTTCSNRVRVSG